MQPILAPDPTESFATLNNILVDNIEWLSDVEDTSNCDVTVVVITRNRPELHKAMTSIYEQDFTGKVAILLIGDNCQELPLVFRIPINMKLTVGNTKLDKKGSPYRRVAQLRNLVCSLVKTKFLCFLDDDNLWEKDHLSTLMLLIQQTDLLAVHSWRRLLNKDGTFFIPNRYLWLPPGKFANSLFSLYCEHGVMSSDDSVIRDKSTLCVGDRDYGMVDMGEWLFNRKLFSLVHFNEQEPTIAHQLHCGEDDKLLQDMRKLAIPVACTSKPTLLYRIGGFSNDFTE